MPIFCCAGVEEHRAKLTASSNSVNGLRQFKYCGSHFSLSLLPGGKSFVVKTDICCVCLVFTCGPIDMTYTRHKVWSLCIPKQTNWTNCTVKAVWPELRKSWKCGTMRPDCENYPVVNNDLVKMTIWDCQEGNRPCIPKLPSEFIWAISKNIPPKNRILTILSIEAKIAGALVNEIII